MTIQEAPAQLEVTPLSATIGAEIRGVDLRDLDDATVAAIRSVWLDRKVVFFPGQHLTADEHVAFAARFGEATEGHPVIPGMKANPEVFEIDYTLARKYATKAGAEPPPQNGIDWHTDVTYMPEPPMGSILRAVTIPAAGGDTMFSDQQAAYDGLSPAMQSFLGSLTAMHDGRPSFQGMLDLVGEGTWNGEKIVSLDPTEHPVIRTHPETGKRTIFVNGGFTTDIVGLTKTESDALLRLLLKHATQPKYTVRYHWHEGDVGFWDNRQTQHLVVGDFGDAPRVIQRVTLRGDRPA
jgi:alpha-ketoglutarate-dependent taurine dioxygenase